LHDSIDVANDFFVREAGEWAIAPVTRQEITSYYREDAMMWRVYLGLRRLDRVIHTYILHKPYVYILPGRIRR